MQIDQLFLIPQIMMPASQVKRLLNPEVQWSTAAPSTYLTLSSGLHERLTIYKTFNIACTKRHGCKSEIKTEKFAQDSIVTA